MSKPSSHWTPLKKEPIPDGYVWKPYHDPDKELRELQPTLFHPPPPSPADCMAVEEQMA